MTSQPLIFRTRLLNPLIASCFTRSAYETTLDNLQRTISTNPSRSKPISIEASKSSVFMLVLLYISRTYLPGNKRCCLQLVEVGCWRRKELVSRTEVQKEVFHRPTSSEKENDSELNPSDKITKIKPVI